MLVAPRSSGMSGLRSIRRRTKLQASPGRSRKAGRRPPASEHRARCDWSVRRPSSSPLVTRLPISGLRRRLVTRVHRFQERCQVDRMPVCAYHRRHRALCPSGDAALREKLHDPFDIRRGGGAALLACLRRGADGADDRRPGAISRDRRAGAGEPHPQRPRRARRLWPRQHPPSVRSGPLSDGARDRARPGDRRGHHGVRSRVQSGRPARPFAVRRALHPRRGLQVAAGRQ